MRKFAKFLSMVIVAATLVGLLSFSTSAASAFTDISSKNVALQEAAEILNNLGIAKGTGEGTFSPKDKVTREQMAAFMYRLMKAGKSVEGGENVSGFTDLKDPTFYYMISWANQSGIIKGRSSTQFDPKGKITLQDCYTMMVRALGYENTETIPYPYGYINIAESIGLAEDVKDSIGYTDELTRGDVAVILYNALYVDMNENYTVNVMPPPEMYSANTALTPMLKEVPETIWHKVFNVTEVTRRVVATPNYGIDLTKIDPAIGFGAEYAVYKPTGVEAPDVPLVYTAAVCVEDDVYGTTRLEKEEKAYKFADLGLSGEADEYFLKDLTMYINPEGKVLACKANGKSGTTSSVSAEYLSGSDKYKYIKNYTVGSTSTTKIRSGTVNIGDGKAYFYTKPTKSKTYAVTLCPTERDDDGRLTYTAGYLWYGDKQSGTFTLEYPYREADKKVYNSTQSANDSLLANILTTSTTGGRYFCDYYDTNGDGVIEYVNMMPMTWGQISVKSGDKNSTKLRHTGDNAYRAVFNSATKMPNICINEKTVVEGGSYEDGKFVFAYVAGPANYVRIASDEVNNSIGHFSSEIVKFTVQKNDDAKNTSVYANGKSMVAYQSTNKIVGHVNAARTGLVSLDDDINRRDSFCGEYKAMVEVGNNVEIYHSGSQVLWAKKLSTSDLINVTEDYAVVRYIDASDDEVVFNAGGIEMDGSLKAERYVQAYINGKFEIVKIAKKAKQIDGTYRDQLNDYFTGKNANGEVVNPVIVNNLSTYTVDSEGYYSFIPASLTRGDLTNTQDDSILYGVEVTDPVILEKYHDILYRFVPGKSSSAALFPASLAPNGMNYAKLDENFKMVVNYIDADGFSDYAVYDYKNQPDFDIDVLEFSKTIAIYRNNPDSVSSEYLNFVYAEVGSEIIVDRDDDAKFGIIVSNVKELDSKANVITKYNIIDPITGEEISNVDTHTKTTELPNFRLYELTTEGKLNTGTNGTVADLTAGSNALHTINQYHSDSGLFTINKATGGTETVVIDENTVVAVFDRENITYEIEDASIFGIEYVDDTDFKYHTPGVTNKTVAVISKNVAGDDIEHAILILVVRG